ncbi:hypothetical protein Tco_1019675 [Tanacetum coccineum]|uniref:Uncharacterized protein n=1 Tax=Tanacetum coccineum TaxID=301880 RepID=A0ABQ5FXV2_9ASTR
MMMTKTLPSAITPSPPTKEPLTLSMGDEPFALFWQREVYGRLVIKLVFKNLVLIQVMSGGNHSETIIDSSDDSTSSDDNSYENIEYVDASPPDDEIVSLENSSGSTTTVLIILFRIMKLSNSDDDHIGEQDVARYTIC